VATIWQRLFGQVETRSGITIPARDTTTATPQTALTLSAVYRAIQIIATPISAMPIETHRYIAGQETKIDNPLFVNKPSLYDSRREFLYQTVASLALTGEAFWVKNFDSQGQVNNVVILPSNSVGVRYESTTSWVKTYDYLGKTLDPKSVEHLRLFTMPGVLRGYGPIQAAAKDIAGIQDLRDYATNWFGNAGVPTGVLKSNMMLNEEEADRIAASWSAKQSNRQTAVLGNGFDYQAIALAPKDAMFIEAQQQAVQLVARLFGIPPRLLVTAVDGSSDTYTNLQDENQVFYRHTIMAYTDPIADALSNCLPRGTSVEFDFEGLFRADIAQRYANYKLAIEAGFMTPEEVRAKESMD
jgi:HK97 family phage portal protein